MRKNRSPILFIVLLLFSTKALAQDPVPRPAGARFPNIRASLNDGFFSLAEQQARGVLRGDPGKEEQREAVLLLAHSLWGQKRYSEMLNLLQAYNGAPGYVYWRARAHFELKDYDAALQILGNPVDKMADSGYAASALRLKGHIEQVSGQLAAAESSFTQFAESFPNQRDRTENQFDLAEVYTRQKRIPEAIALYETMAEQAGGRATQRAQLKLAHLLYSQGASENFDAARNLLTGLATNKNTRLAYRIDAYVDLAALEEKAENRTGAAASMRKAISASPDAHQRVPLKLSLSRMLLRGGDTEGALKLLEECRAEAPNETIAAELQLQKAAALLQAKRYKEAVEAYQIYLAVAADPAGLAQAYFGKGLALVELKRFPEAAVALDKAGPGLNNGDERADALFKAADAYYLAGKFEDAEKRYRLLITDFPDHPNVPNALYQLGLTLAGSGRRADAMEAFQMVEDHYADSPFAENAALRVADLLLADEQWEAALEKYAEIEQTYPSSSVSTMSRHQSGLVLYRLGRYAEAQKIFESVISDAPESEYAPQASYMRGFCLYLQGDAEAAEKTCHEFIEKYPDSEWAPEVIFWLAEQYFNQGAYSEAEPLFLRISTDYKEHKLAPRALYWAGRAAAMQSSYVTAIERYGAVSQTYPESKIIPQTRFAQGDALTELGEFSRAVLAFEEIIKNYPDNYLVNAAWGRKGDCQFSLAVDNPARYSEAMNSYQVILNRPSAPIALKLQAKYKLGRCLEKTSVPNKAFSPLHERGLYLPQ